MIYYFYFRFLIPTDQVNLNISKKMQPSVKNRVHTGMIYLTFADQPSGVFSSQVIDVCKHIDQTFPVKIKLVAFISIRGFKENRQKIKREHPGALVIPMLPKLSFWKYNVFMLLVVCLLLGQKTIISRGVLATNLALLLRRLGIVKNVCYDGRGAIAAEWNEYTVTPDKNLKKEIFTLEKKAVCESDFRIAVSSKLIDYWKEKFLYHDTRHVVIPCTLNTGFSPDLPSVENFTSTRRELGFEKEDLVMVYSGSTAGWQSFKVLEEFLTPLLDANQHNKVLFLSNPDESINRLKTKFPGQVSDRWVNHREVQKVLTACDYGILIREQSVTNQVASPTKFAEYLSAGLAVLISENIGDYSDFVKNHSCGRLIKNNSTENLTPLSHDEKRKLTQLVMANFTKEAQQANYQKLIDSISYNLN